MIHPKLEIPFAIVAAIRYVVLALFRFLFRQRGK